MSLAKLNMSQLAEVTGLDRRTVKDRLKDVKPVGSFGKAMLYNAPEVLPILMGQGKTTDSQLARKLLDEELRLETAKADKTILEVQKLRSEVVLTSDVARIVGTEYSRVRSRIVAIGSRCAVDLSLITDPALVKKRIDEETSEALAELTADTLYEETTNGQFDEATDRDEEEESQAASETKPS